MKELWGLLISDFNRCIANKETRKTTIREIISGG